MNFTDIINTLVTMDLSRNRTSQTNTQSNFLPGRSNIIRYIDEALNETNASQILNSIQMPSVNDSSLNIQNTAFNSSTDDAYGSFLENLFMNPITNTSTSSLSTSNGPGYLQRLLRETLAQQNNYKNIISDEGKKSVLNETYTSDKYTDQKCCPISQIDFKEGDNISKLPCGHIFNPELISKWLENENATCPVCRFKLDSKEEKIKLEETETTETPAIPIQRTRRISEYNHDSFLRRSMYNLLIQQERNREERDIQTALMASLETYDVEQQSADDSELDDVD
jgi:hypothetical protein